MLSRRQLIAKIMEIFRGDVISLSSLAVTSLLVFTSSASNALHIMPDDRDDHIKC